MFVFLTKAARSSIIRLFTCCIRSKEKDTSDTATIDTSSADESSPIMKSDKKHMTSYSESQTRTLTIIQDT